MPKFLIDHNVPKSVGNYLKQQKYNVKWVGDIDPELTDTEVIKVAQKEDRVILSNDKDFLSLSVKYNNIDMILFDYLNQGSDIRIQGLKKVLPELQQPFGVIVMQ